MNNINEWSEFLNKNWSQILLILGCIVYFIQKSYEFKLKKGEIKFSKLQENKILEIKSFYKSYQALFLLLKQYADESEYGNKDDNFFHIIKEKIRDKIIDFEYNCMTIKLFIDSKDVIIIDEIIKTFEEIRFGVSMWHNNNRSLNYKEKYDDNLTKIINETIPNKLPYLIKQIEDSLRKSFDLR